MKARRITTVTAFHAARVRTAGALQVNDVSALVLEHIYAGECQVCEAHSDLEARLRSAAAA